MAQPIEKQCPKCKIGRLDARVKRSFFIKYVLFWLPYKRYRCDYCNRKSYILSPKNQSGGLQVV